MSASLDWLSLRFVLYARSLANEVLDIGCGDGLAAAAVIERGGHVLAVDPEEAYIAQLRARIPMERHARLRTQIGALPEIDFASECFGAIHAAHVLQLLSGPHIVRALEKMHRWLQPGGRLFLSAVTRALSSDDPETGFIQLLDQHSLRRELTRAGFSIEEIKFYAPAWDADESCCAIIAFRPASGFMSQDELRERSRPQA